MGSNQVPRLNQSIEILKDGYRYRAEEKAMELQVLQRSLSQAAQTDLMGRDAEYNDFVLKNIAKVIESSLTKCTQQSPVEVSDDNLMA